MSTRVEHILHEIAQFSSEERQELTEALPRVAPLAPDHGLSEAVLAQADKVKARILARLRAEGQSRFSVDDDLDAIRDERMGEIERSLPSTGRAL